MEEKPFRILLEMLITDFIQCSTCDPSLSPALQALWHDHRGDWYRAHTVVQDEGDRQPLQEAESPIPQMRGSTAEDLRA